MSRLIVKNLPKGIKEDKLRSLFAQKGDITDIQLKYTPDGKFRQFGFIGFRTPEQAQEAIDYFNNSCINTSRINVELCANLGDATKPKSWSKYATDSSAYQKANEKPEEVEEEIKPTKKSKKKDKKKKEKEEIQKLVDEHKSDPLFEEYLATKLKTGSVWANDNVIQQNDETDVVAKSVKIPEVEEDDEEEDDEESEEKPADAKISDLEYMKSLMVKKPRQKMEKKVKAKIDLFTLKLQGLSYSCKKKDLKLFFKPLTPYSIRIPRHTKGFAFVGFKTEKEFKKALLKDKSFMGGKQIIVIKYEKKDIEENNNANSKKFKNTPWKDKEELLKNEEDIATSGKIFVRNLAYTTTEEDLQKLFETYGPLTEVNLPVDKTSRQIKGFGTITFVFPEHAAKAYCELDGSVLSGRMLHLLPVKSKPEPEESEESTNYKKQKDQKQKQQAGSSHNWNSLFIDSNAVANVISKNYDTSKETLLGTEIDSKNATSAAVRLALGETQLVQNMQSFLESNDIHLDAFNDKKTPRSKTTILVKNLPSGATEYDIRDRFKSFGPLSRVIFPPNGLTAVVEYYEPSEARAAFKKLAYTKFINAPLYLEWAPENVFKTPPPDPNKVEEKTPAEDVEEEADADEEPEENTVLFIKNLYFGTTDLDLNKHFAKCGKIKYATVATKNNPQKPGEKLSMGYGFVRFMREADAEEALKKLQFSELDGKSLELKRSERSTQQDVQTARKIQSGSKANGTKLLVRNIPFQANKKEISDLFTPFGEIKALRLPQKMSGESHRGFAFVDYQTKADAKRAFKALSQSTHLYGRRLVLEWAENDVEDIAELRKRTADQMQQGSKSKQFKKSYMEVGEKEEKDDEV